MDHSHSNTQVSRRDVLQILTALGFSGVVAADLAAQATPQVTGAALRSAASLLSGSFDEQRLEVSRVAVQRNLDQTQVVRDLEIPDAVEPGLVFLVRR